MLLTKIYLWCSLDVEPKSLKDDKRVGNFMLPLQSHSCVVLWKFQRQVSGFHPSTIPFTQYIEIYSLFWVAAVTKKLNFGKQKQTNNNNNNIIVCWQLCGSAVAFSPLNLCHLLWVQQKYCAAMRSVCHWPLLMCKFTSPLNKTLLTLSLSTWANLERWMHVLILTHTHLPTSIITAWQTQRKANIGRREVANKVCKELITNMTTTE